MALYLDTNPFRFLLKKYIIYTDPTFFSDCIGVICFTIIFLLMVYDLVYRFEFLLLVISRRIYQLFMFSSKLDIYKLKKFLIGAYVFSILHRVCDCLLCKEQRKNYWPKVAQPLPGSIHCGNFADRVFHLTKKKL